MKRNEETGQTIEQNQIIQRNRTVKQNQTTERNQLKEQKQRMEQKGMTKQKQRMEQKSMKEQKATTKQKQRMGQKGMIEQNQTIDIRTIEQNQNADENRKIPQMSPNVFLGKTKIEVTTVGVGTLTVGPFQKNFPVDEGASILRYALESGIRFLDTAQYYQTYPQVKLAIKGLSFDPVICSKSLCKDGPGMKQAIEECRQELDRDVIDLFLMHEVRGREDWLKRSAAWEALLNAREKGLIRAAGISTHHVDAALYGAGQPEMDVLFPLINVQSIGIRNGNGPGTKEEMEAAVKLASSRGIGVFAMKVFGGGNLVGSFQKAISYIRSIPEIKSMMLGLGTREEVDRAVEVMEGTLNSDYVPSTEKKRMKIDEGDCIGCLSCYRRCPNHAISINEKGLARIDDALCLTCGYCAPVCPVMAIIYL